MKKLICYKRKPWLLPAIMLLAFLLLAGCGNKDTQKDKPVQEGQTEEGQDSRQPAGTDAQQAAEPGSQTEEGQDNQQPTGTDNQQPAGQGGNHPEEAQDNNQPEGAGAQPSDSQQTVNQQPAGQGGNQSGLANQPKLGVEEAKEAALKHAGLTSQEVTFIKEELDYDDGITEYEIEFVTSTTKYEYEINAADGAVLGSSQEPVEQIPENLQGQGVVSVDEAKEALLNHAGFQPEQVAFTKVELELDDGVVEYEIEFYADGKEYSGKVNASTGAIMKYGME